MELSTADLPASQLSAFYRTGEISPVDVAQVALDRIREHDKSVNAFCDMNEEITLAQARRSEERYLRHEPLGLLDGVPVAVKDMFLAKGWPRLKGSRLMDRRNIAEIDSPAVAALRRSGFVCIGRTTTPEYAWKGVTDSPLTGITRNPWDPERTAGGSSGGSAAAVALGMAPLSLGTDGGGSIRIPASFCGVVGHKPTQGRVPFWPPSDFGNLAHPGPMAWTVHDVALLLNVISEPHFGDTTLPPNGHDFLKDLNGSINGLRVAYSETLGYVNVQPDISDNVKRALRVFEDLGARVEPIDPGFKNPESSFECLFYGGAANAMRDIGEKDRAVMDSSLVQVAEWAEKLSALDYMAGLNVQRQITERMNQFHLKYDLLLTPTMPISPFEAGREVPPNWPKPHWPSWTPFTYPFNMTGQPACSVPCGFDSKGMPVGLQVIGARHRDDLVLRAANAYQLAAPLTDRRPAMLE